MRKRERARERLKDPPWFEKKVVIVLVKNCSFREFGRQTSEN